VNVCERCRAVLPVGHRGSFNPGQRPSPLRPCRAKQQRPGGDRLHPSADGHGGHPRPRRSASTVKSRSTTAPSLRVIRHGERHRRTRRVTFERFAAKRTTDVDGPFPLNGDSDQRNGGSRPVSPVGRLADGRPGVAAQRPTAPLTYYAPSSTPNGFTRLSITTLSDGNGDQCRQP